MAEKSLPERQYVDSFQLEYSKLGLEILKVIKNDELRDRMLVAFYDHLNETRFVTEGK